MINHQLINELGAIIKEDYKKDLNQKDLVEIADSLVSYFDLLKRAHNRNNFNKNKDEYRENKD